MEYSEEHKLKIIEAIGKIANQNKITFSDIFDFQSCVLRFLEHFANAPSESDLDLFLDEAKSQESQRLVDDGISFLAEALKVDAEALKEKINELKPEAIEVAATVEEN